MTKTTDTLRELLAKATPGPWAVDLTLNEALGGCYWREIRAGEHGSTLGEVFHDLGDPDPSLTDEDAAANAALIVALRNEAPDLLDTIDRLQSQVADAERDWAPYAAKAPCETKGPEDMEPGCCAPCRARQALERSKRI
jgi:hypothetical protein